MIFKGGKEDYDEVILYGIGVWDLYIQMYSVFIVKIYILSIVKVVWFNILLYYFMNLFSIFFIL